MNDFLTFVDKLRKRFPIHVDIYYSKVMDWCIMITKKGCASDYPEAVHDGDDIVIVDAQDADMELCFARAHVALKDWLIKFNGGY